MKTCFLHFRILKAATKQQYFCVIIFSQHCALFSEKNCKKHLLFLFFLQIWNVLMLLVIISFMSQSAVADDLYSQKSKAILTVLLQWKIEEERRKKIMRKRYLSECFTNNSDYSMNESNTQLLLNCIWLTFTTFIIYQWIVHIRKDSRILSRILKSWEWDSKREDSVMIQITWQSVTKSQNHKILISWNLACKAILS